MTFLIFFVLFLCTECGLHGKFEFQQQKYQINKKEANYFELSEQLQERFVSPRACHQSAILSFRHSKPFRDLKNILKGVFEEILSVLLCLKA
jgi:hypothetical protein